MARDKTSVFKASTGYANGNRLHSAPGGVVPLGGQYECYELSKRCIFKWQPV
jgi:hypothetical protein